MTTSIHHILGATSSGINASVEWGPNMEAPPTCERHMRLYLNMVTQNMVTQTLVLTEGNVRVILREEMIILILSFKCLHEEASENYRQIQQIILKVLMDLNSISLFI